MMVTLCHNPTAGDGNHNKKELLAALELASIDARYCSTKDDDFPGMLSEPADLIVSAGGDGTIAKVIKNMPDRKVPIAIIPLGTANNIARSFGIAGTPHELSESWRLDHWRPFDIGLLQGSWGREHFIDGIGLGALAGAMKKTSSKLAGVEKLMTGRRDLQEKMREAQPIDATVVVDGVPLQEEGMLAVEMINAAYIGPGLPLPPVVDPSDRSLSIIVIGLERRDAMLSWLAAPHKAQMPVPILSGRRIEFDCSGAALRLDDDNREGPQSGTAEIEGTAIRLLVRPSNRR